MPNNPTLIANPILYDNFVLENVIKSALDTKLDINRFMTADYSLAENPGMVKKVHKYSITADSDVDDLERGQPPFHPGSPDKANALHFTGPKGACSLGEELGGGSSEPPTTPHGYQPSRCSLEGFLEEEMLKVLPSWSSPGRPGFQLSKVGLC